MYVKCIVLTLLYIFFHHQHLGSLLKMHNRKIGGVGWVDIKDYLTAACLDQIRQWFKDSSEILWLEVKSSLTLISDLPLLLLADIQKQQDIRLVSLTVQSSVEAWRVLLLPSVWGLHNKAVSLPTQVLKSLMPMLSVRQLLNQGVYELMTFTTVPSLRTWRIWCWSSNCYSSIPISPASTF